MCRVPDACLPPNWRMTGPFAMLHPGALTRRRICTSSYSRRPAEAGVGCGLSGSSLVALLSAAATSPLPPRMNRPKGALIL